MSEHRAPPHDLDSEAAVLSAVMIERSAIDRVTEILAPEHFYSEANRRMFEAAVDLGRRSQPIDTVTVASWLRDHDRMAQVGGPAYIAQIVDAVPAVAHVETYARKVREKWRIRQLIATCQSFAAEGYAPIDDADAYIDRAEQAVFHLAQEEERRDVAPIGDVMTKSYKRMLANEARGTGVVELSTGLVALDSKTLGLGRGCVTVVAARPGMGKTALACGFAQSVASLGDPVAIFSLEMPDSDLTMRMACARAGADARRGIKGCLLDAERGSVIREMQFISKLPIWIDDTPGAGLMRIRSKSRAVAARAGKRLGLVVVDYLQLMRGRRDSRVTRDQELSEITAGFKTLAKELDCAIVLLSQLNRECESEKDKRPHLRHLRESGGIEQDADDVVFVYRDEYYNHESKEKGIAELIVAKQRNGPTGTVKVAFLGRSTSFEDLHASPERPETPEED